MNRLFFKKKLLNKSTHKPSLADCVRGVLETRIRPYELTLKLIFPSHAPTGRAFNRITLRFNDFKDKLIKLVNEI